MNTIAAAKPQDLPAILNLTDDQLFTVPVLSQALNLLTEKASGLVADVSDPAGRKEINKTARAVGGAIRRLDERRAAFVAELKRQPAEIDRLFREVFRAPAEQLKERIKAPLDAWAEEQREAEEETTRLIDWITSPVEAGTKAEAIAQRLELTRELDLPAWVSETQRDAITAALQHAIPRLEQAQAAAEQAEAQALELDRLRKLERKAEIAKAREEAAAQARAEAEAAAERRAQEAERHAAAEIERAREQAAAAREEERQQRQAQAETQAERRQGAEQCLEAARQVDETHCTDAVRREIAADLEFAVPGLSLETANRIVAAIERGEIPRLQIAA